MSLTPIWPRKLREKRPRRVTVLRCGPKCIGHYLIVSVSVNPKLKVSGLLRLRRFRRVVTWALRTIQGQANRTDLFGRRWVDFLIIRMRRRLIQAAQDLQEGIEPYAASHPEVYKVRSGGAVLPRDVYFTEDASVRDDIIVK